MIDLYTGRTGNGQRPAIILEELGLPYRVHVLDLGKGDQRKPEFLRLNPRGAIPVVVDDDGPGGQRLVLAQSHAILLHYAMQEGRFLPTEPMARALCFQWVSHVASDAAPTSGVLFAVQNFVPEKSEANTQFFVDRLLTNFKYIDGRLGQVEYLAGELSIADFSLYPVYKARHDMIEGAGLRNFQRWAKTMGARPALKKALEKVG
jgi:GST-like protein